MLAKSLLDIESGGINRDKLVKCRSVTDWICGLEIKETNLDIDSISNRQDRQSVHDRGCMGMYLCCVETFF